MSITLASVLPYLLVIGGYAVRHFELFSKLGALIGIAAGPNPLAPASTGPALPNVTLGNHPILSDAVNAAIRQTVADVTAGHVASIKDELKAVAQAAVAAAIADLKAKV